MNLSALPKRVALDAIRWAPKGLYTRAIGWGARRRLPRPVRRPLYSTFARCVGASLEEVELPLEEYPSLGSFFARRLRAGARPIVAQHDAVLAPCDGVVAAAGSVRSGQLIQAKGHLYDLAELVADQDLAAPLCQGSYVTLYLSPRDYHRVHVPFDAEVLGFSHIPGRLLPVSPTFAEAVPHLLSRNERVVFHLQTKAGPAAVVMVGATGVGNIAITYPGAGAQPVESRHFRNDGGVRRQMHAQAISVEQGQELGVFELGSTVVLLLPAGVGLHVAEHGSVRVGEVIGRLRGEGPR